jgi:aminoglycoside phosphotransferase (APT) family kinase protein
MTKMHENEFNIDENLVRSLLKSQCPEWAHLPLKTIPSSGTDNALFRLGNDYVVRLPRLDGANNNINKEYKWLPILAALLKIPISEPIFKGNSDKNYPSLWLITKWNEGHNPEFEQENEYGILAKDLADFLNKLHSVGLPNGPHSRRGVPLKELNEETTQAITQLEGEIDIQVVTCLWQDIMNIPYWNKAPVWIHGDFLPGNILVQYNQLSAVLDWSDVGIGDPGCDLVIAWGLLNANSREIFKNNLQNIDDHTWERGRGWALSIALIMLPYYKYTNPILASLARRLIANVLRD